MNNTSVIVPRAKAKTTKSIMKVLRGDLYEFASTTGIAIFLAALLYFSGMAKYHYLDERACDGDPFVHIALAIPNAIMIMCFLAVVGVATYSVHSLCLAMRDYSRSVIERATEEV